MGHQRTLVLIVIFFAANVQRLPADEAESPPLRPTPEVYLRIAAETEKVLHKDILDTWFPAAVDMRGGYFENFSRTWTRTGPSDERSIVYQSRLTWLAAQAAQQFPSDRKKYLGISRCGLQFLAARQWDQTTGGFFWKVKSSNTSQNIVSDEKVTYGIAFGIYAAATNYKQTKDPLALDLAQKAFTWLDKHGHDARHGGFAESFSADGQPMDKIGRRGQDPIGTPYGQRSMNTSIHVLEALTALRSIWPDPIVRARTKEMFEIVRDKVYTDPGCLSLYFSSDWRAIVGDDSFGHDIETAYLLAEAAAAQGIPDDAQTWRNGRRLVDHALDFGFDKRRGGFYDTGTASGGNLRTDKIWWVEAEGLNALLLMHERFGRETPRYWNAFLQQWRFISKYQIDHVNAGWYPVVSADGNPVGPAVKSDAWTEGYHQGRAMMNVTNLLRKLADDKN